MQTDRSTILHLVALGRITPAEAERLLLAWNEGREELWVLAAGVALAGLAQLRLHELLPVLARLVHALSPQILTALHQPFSLFADLLGGIL
jgi:hypothetical protein